MDSDLLDKAKQALRWSDEDILRNIIEAELNAHASIAFMLHHFLLDLEKKIIESSNFEALELVMRATEAADLVLKSADTTKTILSLSGENRCRFITHFHEHFNTH